MIINDSYKILQKQIVKLLEFLCFYFKILDLPYTVKVHLFVGTNIRGKMIVDLISLSYKGMEIFLFIGSKFRGLPNP